MNYRNTSVGTGSAAEQVVPLNGLFVVPKGSTLALNGYVVSTDGPVTVRLREDSVTGPIVMELEFPSKALIGGDIIAALEFIAVQAAKTLVVTEEGQYRNVTLLTGMLRANKP